MRVDVPRSRASCPSAESSTSETMNSRTPAALIHVPRYQNRCPARTPSTRLASVTASADTRVFFSAVAIRHPSGRKNRRSAHSSTTGPLLAYTGARLFQHRLYGGQRFQCLLVGDDERWIDPYFRIVDHGDHAAREQRVENPPRRLLVEQVPRSRHDQIHADHESLAADVAHDRDLVLPPL